MQLIELGQDWTFDFAVRTGDGPPEDADSLPTVPNTKTQVDGVQTALTATVTQLEDNTATDIPGLYQVAVDISGRSVNEVITVVVDVTLDSVNQSSVFTATIVPAQRGTDSANTVVPLAAAVDQAEHDATQADIAALNDLAIADVQTAMTNQGYTSALATELDGLDPKLTAALYSDGIFIDLTSGTAGTGALVGTQALPSSNITDAITIAAAQGLTVFKFVGSIGSLSFSSANITALNTIGPRFLALTPTTVDFSATGAPHTLGTWSFEGPFQIDTANVGIMLVVDFRNIESIDVDAATALWEVDIFGSRVFGNINRLNSSARSIRLINCFSAEDATLTVSAPTFISDWEFQTYRWVGDLFLEGFVNPGVGVDATIDMLGGTLNVDATNTEADRIRVTGIGNVTGAEAANVQDDRVTIPSASDISDSVWQAVLSTVSAASGDAAETLRTLEKIFTNDATVVDIGGGINQVTVFDDDGTTVLRRMNVSADGLTRDVIVGG